MSLVHWVFVSIHLQFLRYGIIQIHTKHISKSNQIKRHISKFLTHSGSCVSVGSCRFGGVLSKPLKNFGKFAYFTSKRHHQIFG